MPVSAAIDGPAGAGKSTAAREAARRLGYLYADTGALYRAVAYYVISKEADPKNKDEVIPLLKEISVELKYSENGQRVVVNGEDVTDNIRTPVISMGSSAVSAYPEVREFLLELQRGIARENNVIMDGRDIGTVVLPDADVKIFFTASPSVRAERRAKELASKGGSPIYEEVLAEINERDKKDSTRDIAPLKRAADAVYMDTSDNTADQSASIIVALIEGAVSGKYPIVSEKYKAVTAADGAELTSFTDGNGTEYIWQADPDIWARHAPVLFPFICSTSDKKFTVGGNEYSMSNHGFARDTKFAADEMTCSKIVYKLVADEAVKEKYPFDFEFRVSYELRKNRLRTEFITENKGERDMFFFVGGHPGFNCPLESWESFEDYFVEYEKPENIVRVLADGTEQVIAENSDTVDMNREIFRDDVFMKDKPDSNWVALRSRKSSKCVKVNFDRKGCIAVWSPYKENASFVCLEPWSSVPIYREDTKELTEMKLAVKLAPSEKHTFKFDIEIY